MDQKTRKNIQEKLKKRTMQLPPIFQEFLKENQKTLSLSSRYEYAKDFHLFSDYLRDTYAEDVTDQLIIHLEKREFLTESLSSYSFFSNNRWTRNESAIQKRLLWII